MLGSTCLPQIRSFTLKLPLQPPSRLRKVSLLQPPPSLRSRIWALFIVKEEPVSLSNRVNLNSGILCSVMPGARSATCSRPRCG